MAGDLYTYVVSGEADGPDPEVVAWQIMGDDDHVGLLLALSDGRKVGAKWDADAATTVVIGLLQGIHHIYTGNDPLVDNAGQ